MIRISATQLESYRRWLLNDESTIDNMIDFLLKRTPPTEAMRAGLAFHKVLETAKYNDELAIVEQDGFKFDLSGLDCEIALPEAKEFKLEKQTVIDGELVTFVGVVDAIKVNEIFDHKLTSQLNAENYIDSMQWRCYLDWFDCDKFTYNLFQSYKPANQDVYLIKTFLPVSFYRYEGIDLDVRNMASSFICFVKNYIPELIK
ncbi:hypothetical protein A9G48_04340 [Gilliamella sp. wkB18]|uniref:hypothetical protein n=1 Tax=Gilliamella sp. wkB18 TaxID=3120260 RepID=UPI00080DD473|nr:hypothetical protein [Gilliamella apicola]OCG64035.1 hypothetical protein A9G48_04340 [Gilliamella apicola]